MSNQALHIGTIVLKWGPWKTWADVRRDVRKGGENVPHRPGVYEVMSEGHATERLYIGMASSLRMRVKQGLVKGKVPHNAYKKLHGRSATLMIRWAKTRRPAAAEEALLRLYEKKHGETPKFNRPKSGYKG